jgi:hypothetical protein
MLDVIKNAVEAEIKRRERVIADPDGVNMFLDPVTKKPRPAAVSEIQPDYSGIEAAADLLCRDVARDVRMECVSLVCKQMRSDPNTVDWVVNAADKLADYVLNGKAGPEEKSNG